MAPARVRLAAQVVFLGCQVQAKEVLHRENHHGESVKQSEQGLVRVVNDGDMFEQQRKQIGHNQKAHPLVHLALVVAGDLWIEHPGVQPAAHGQITGNVRLLDVAEDDFHFCVQQRMR